MTSERDPREPDRLDLAVSDPSQLPAVRDWLRAQPGVEVRLTAGTTGPNEQGVLDVLTVLAGSSGLVAAIKILPEFVRSRRSDIHIEATVRGEKFVLNATNVRDVMPVVERALGDD